MRSILLALLLLGLGADHAFAQARAAIPFGTGDVNGDFHSDVLLPDATGVRVVFGAAGPLAAANGFRILGTGLRAPTIAGDVNGDGLDDVLVGDGSAVYVVFGKRDSAPVELTHLDRAGIMIDAPYGGVGLSTFAGVGDVNGDGLDDMLVGAPGLPSPHAADNGGAFLVRGRRTGGRVDLGIGPLVGFYGDTGDHAGESLAGPGDLNGDKIPDFVIGGLHPTIVYGRRPPRGLGLAGIRNRLGHRFPGVLRRVAPAGDFDYDGFHDFVLGHRIVFGGRRGGPLTMALPFAATGAGDVNGNGLTDLVAGAHGQVLIALGTQTRAPVKFRALAPGTDPVPVGDVDGDGRDDILATDPAGAPVVVFAGGREVPIGE